MGESNENSCRITKIFDSKPDLVLMDLKLSDMEGFEATRRMAWNGICKGGIMPSFSQRLNAGMPKAELMVFYCLNEAQYQKVLECLQNLHRKKCA